MKAIMSTIVLMLGAVILVVGALSALTIAFSPAVWFQTLLDAGCRGERLLGLSWSVPLAAAAVGLAGVVAVLTGESARKKTSVSTSHGSARYSSTEEICPEPGMRQQGVVLCQQSEADVEAKKTLTGKPVWIVRREAPFVCAQDGHVLIEGFTGSGKDVSIVLPTLLTDVSRSYVVSDPKGKTRQQTAGYRNRYQDTSRFAPCSADTDCFNPLDFVAMGTDEVVADVEEIAAEMVGSTAAEEKDSHIYLEVAELVLVATMLHVLHYAPPGRRHLPECLKVLTRPGATNQQRLMDICSRPVPGGEDVLNSARELAGDKKMCQGAFTTALGTLKFCRIPSVARAISRSDFKPSDLSNGKNPRTIYLEFPFRRAKILRPLARLVLYSLQSHHVEERRWDTCYLLNEMASFGNIASLVNGVAELREYGVQFAFFIQSEGQLFMHYGKEAAQTIMDNCPNRVTLGVAGQKSAESLRDRMGKTTLVRPRTTKAVSRKSILEKTETNTEGEAEQAREMLTSDEAKALDSIYVTVEFTHSRPYLGKRAVSYSQAELIRRSKVPPPSRLQVVGGASAA